MERKFISIEDLQKLYEELAPWDRADFCEWIKTREEFEIYPSVDLEDTEISLDDIADRYTDDELLSVCDSESVVDYVLCYGLEDMVIDAYDEEELARYLSRSHHKVLECIGRNDIDDAERDKIFNVAYGQGFRDGKNERTNKCNPE